MKVDRDYVLVSDDFMQTRCFFLTMDFTVKSDFFFDFFQTPEQQRKQKLELLNVNHL